MPAPSPRLCPGRRLVRGGWFDEFRNNPTQLAALQLGLSLVAGAGLVGAWVLKGAPAASVPLIVLAVINGLGGLLSGHVRRHPPAQALRAAGVAQTKIDWWAAYEVQGGAEVEELVHHQTGGAKAHDTSGQGPPSYAFMGSLAVSYVATTHPEVVRVDLYSLRFPAVSAEDVQAARELLEAELSALGLAWQEVPVAGEPDAIADPRNSTR